MQLIKCPHCQKYNTLRKAGYQDRANLGQIQQWRCKHCGKSTTKPALEERTDDGKFIPKQSRSNG